MKYLKIEDKMFFIKLKFEIILHTTKKISKMNEMKKNSESHNSTKCLMTISND